MAFGKETIQVRKPIRAVSKADGNMDGLYPDHLRQSDFIVENMTIVNNAANTTDNVDRMQDVIKVRRGAKATIKNALVKGTGGTIDLIDMKDSKGAGDANSSINITNTLSITGGNKVEW